MRAELPKPCQKPMPRGVPIAVPADTAFAARAPCVWLLRTLPRPHLSTTNTSVHPGIPSRSKHPSAMSAVQCKPHDAKHARARIVRRCSGAVGDEGVCALARGCASLEVLDLGSSAATPTGVQALLAGCPLLCALELGSCRGLPRAARVTWGGGGEGVHAEGSSVARAAASAGGSGWQARLQKLLAAG